MKTLMIAFYTILRHFRDVKSMIAFTLLPIVLMLILGAALNSEFTPKTIDKMKVGVISEDEGILHSSLDHYFAAEELTSILQVEEVLELEEGIAKVKSGKYEVLIYLRPNLSRQLNDDTQVQIELYTKSENSVVQPILEGFIRTFNLGNVLVSIDGKMVNTKQNESNIQEIKIVTEGKIPRGIDYYAIATMFQTLLFGSLFGVFAITKDLGNHTYSRLLAAPIRSSQLMFGKLIGSTVTLYGISLLIFILTKYIFKANWNGDLWVILLVLLLFSMIAIMFGMIMAYLTKSTMISSLTLFIVTTILTLVAGGFSPYLEGKVIDVVSLVSPNYYSQNILFTTIYDGFIDYTKLQGLLIYALVLILFTFIAGRRRMV